eukprot:Opistho-2@15545
MRVSVLAAAVCALILAAAALPSRVHADVVPCGPTCGGGFCPEGLTCDRICVIAGCFERCKKPAEGIPAAPGTPAQLVFHVHRLASDGFTFSLHSLDTQIMTACQSVVFPTLNDTMNAIDAVKENAGAKRNWRASVLVDASAMCIAEADDANVHASHIQRLVSQYVGVAQVSFDDDVQTKGQNFAAKIECDVGYTGDECDECALGFKKLVDVPVCARASPSARAAQTDSCDTNVTCRGGLCPVGTACKRHCILNAGCADICL